MKKTIIIILIILALGSVYLLATSQTYEKFNLIRIGADTIPACKVYNEQCTCYGLLSIAKSFPPQYSCLGIPLCKPITRDEPPGCSQE